MLLVSRVSVCHTRSVAMPGGLACVMAGCLAVFCVVGEVTCVGQSPSNQLCADFGCASAVTAM